MAKRITKEEAYSRYKEKYNEIASGDIVLKNGSDMYTPSTFYQLYGGLREEGRTLRQSINEIIDSQLANSSQRTEFFIDVRDKFMQNIFESEGRFQELKGMRKAERSPEDQREFERLQHKRTELIKSYSPDNQFRKWMMYNESTLKKQIQSKYNTTGDWLRWMNDVMSQNDGESYSDISEWYYLP